MNFSFSKKCNVKIIKEIITFLMALFFTTISLAQTPVKVAGGYHLIDDYDGEVLTRETYDFIDKEESGRFLAVQQGEFCFLNNNGVRSPKSSFDLAYPFHNEFALIGKGGKYHYTNKQGQLFDTLDWPKKPTIYKDVLIYGNSPQYIVHSYGGQLLRTNNTLVAAKENGIFEWDKKHHIVHHYFLRGTNLQPIQTIENVDSIAVTWQGYACVIFDSSFTIYNAVGKVLFEDLPLSNYYLPIKILWNKYLYLNKADDLVHRFEDEIRSEPMYDLIQMKSTDGRNKYGPSVLLGQGFENEKIVKLRGSDKWVLFYDKQVRGMYLFDKVLPSDKNNHLLVRHNSKWFLYHVSKETLTPLPFRYIHPKGLDNEVYFGSNDNAKFRLKKWSYNTLGTRKEAINTPEIYQFENKAFGDKNLSHPSRYHELPSNSFYKLWLDSVIIVLNHSGQKIFTETHQSQFEIQDFFKPQFHMKAGPTRELKSKKGLKRNAFQITLTKNKNEHTITIINTTKTGKRLERLDNYIDVSLQYKRQKDEWVDFTEYSPEFANNFHQTIEIPSQHYLQENIFLPPGNARVWVRVKIAVNTNESIYSEPIQMNICPAMLYGNRYFEKYGAFSKLFCFGY